jgi:hypothetical protein
MENQELITDKNLIILGGQASGKTTLAMRYERFYGPKHTIIVYAGEWMNFWSEIHDQLMSKKMDVRLIICEEMPTWEAVRQIDALVRSFHAMMTKPAPQLIFTSNSLRPHTIPTDFNGGPGRFRAFELKGGKVVKHD